MNPTHDYIVAFVFCSFLTRFLKELQIKKQENNEKMDIFCAKSENNVSYFFNLRVIFVVVGKVTYNLK